MTETSAGTSEPVEGWVDGCLAGTLRGWAWRPTAPTKTVEVEVLIAGTVIAMGATGLKRLDLQNAGKGDGAHGFLITLDLDALSGTTADLVVRAKGGAVLNRGEISIDLVDQRAAAVAETVAADTTNFPIRLGGAAGVTGYLDCFGPERIGGWMSYPERPSGPVLIELWEGDRDVGSFSADIWRTDLEEMHQGDGRWGFEAPFPPALEDGKAHMIDLRLDGRTILPAPLSVQFPPRERGPWHSLMPLDTDPDTRAVRSRPLRHAIPTEPLISVVVVFYNMRREAQRTLTSLTRAYQRGIGELPYEVLCVDNGSADPLEAAWIESFGPEFRLIRPSEILRSPCRAINEAAAAAKGRYLAIMIDGAHLLTPGVFREVWDAVEEAPDLVVALRQWFIGGDQRWLSSVGYSGLQEDILFDKIHWPQDGYKLFKIGTPIWESPHHWFHGIIESNCLFLPRAVYQSIGGMDEAFSEPGAGYANLDLFKRAAAAVEEPVVALLGEASFHQFHGGTTTNVSDDDKDRAVRTYEDKYTRLRGEPFAGVKEADIRFRGQHRAMAGVSARHRPTSPARLGLTDQVRPGVRQLHLGETMADYLCTAYVECGLNRGRWQGHDLSLAPPDIVAIQELVHQQRPDRIIAVNAAAGVLHLADGALRLADLPRSRIIGVGQSQHDGLPATVVPIIGAPEAPETRIAVTRALADAERVLVLFTPAEGDHFPIATLSAYARFVSPRSYIVFLGSAFGQPWLGYSKNWYLKAIRTLVTEAPFAVDESWNRHLATTCPQGFLQRIGNDASASDDTGNDDTDSR